LPPDTAIALIKEAGEALYGPRWQRELARLLGVLDVRVRDWQAGRRTIPAEIWPRIHGALAAKKSAVAAAQKKVARAC
jgi:DNA-binding transcriptional regulator YdaS (Cro superfamily)